MAGVSPARLFGSAVAVVAALGCGRVGFQPGDGAEPGRPIDVFEDGADDSAKGSIDAGSVGKLPPTALPEGGVDGGVGAGGDGGQALAPVDDGGSPTEAQDGGQTSTADGGPTSTQDGGAAVPAGCGTPYAGQLWCADFEDGVPSGTLTATYAGSIGTTGDRAHGGQRALRARTESGDGYAAALWDVAQLDYATVHWRGWVYVPGGPTLEDLTLYRVGRFNSPAGGVDVDLTDGELEVYVWRNGNVVRSGVAFPRDRWVCVQGQVLVDHKGSFEVRLDGTSVVQASGEGTRPSNGLADFSTGLVWTRDIQPPITVYHDDLVVGSEPIPCE